MMNTVVGIVASRLYLAHIIDVWVDCTDPDEAAHVEGTCNKRLIEKVKATHL